MIEELLIGAGLVLILGAALIAYAACAAGGRADDEWERVRAQEALARHHIYSDGRANVVDMEERRRDV